MVYYYYVCISRQSSMITDTRVALPQRQGSLLRYQNHPLYSIVIDFSCKLTVFCKDHLYTDMWDLHLRHFFHIVFFVPSNNHRWLPYAVLTWPPWKSFATIFQVFLFSKITCWDSGMCLNKSYPSDHRQLQSVSPFEHLLRFHLPVQASLISHLVQRGSKDEGLGSSAFGLGKY